MSAYVQEGNKREIVTANFDDTCDIELFGNFSFNFGAHFTAMKFDQTLSLFHLSQKASHQLVLARLLWCA